MLSHESMENGTSEKPATVIKITRYNLYRPTSLLHEAGHQVAHIVGWNEELASALAAGLAEAPAVADALDDLAPRNRRCLRPHSQRLRGRCPAARRPDGQTTDCELSAKAMNAGNRRAQFKRLAVGWR